jgi:hypothetical protein
MLMSESQTRHQRRFEIDAREVARHFHKNWYAQTGVAELPRSGTFFLTVTALPWGCLVARRRCVICPTE